MLLAYILIMIGALTMITSWIGPVKNLVVTCASISLISISLAATAWLVFELKFSDCLIAGAIWSAPLVGYGLGDWLREWHLGTIHNRIPISYF